MIHRKSPEEIAIMKEGGEKLRAILAQLLSEVKAGKTGMDIERLALALLAKAGGKASFQMVPNYKWATCICINDGVVHGVPNEIPFQEGDVVGIDIGMYYKGFHTDTSWTIQIKDQRSEIKDKSGKINKFLTTGEVALEQAILACKIGNSIGHISNAIQHTVEQGGYSVVRELVGHGVGKQLHEDPEVPCFLGKKIEKTLPVIENMVLAIEVIYTMGKPEIYIDERDGWTIRTKDGTLSALFEKTVALGSKGAVVLT